MGQIFLLFQPTKRQQLSDLQLKKLADYFFTLSAIVFGSGFLKFFENKEKIALDKESFIVLGLNMALTISLALAGLFLLGKIKENKNE